MSAEAISKSRDLVARSRQARASAERIIQTTLRTISDSQRLIWRAARTTRQPPPGYPWGGTMTAHKFAVGEAVSFSPDQGQAHTKGDLFEIVRLLPDAGDVLQYRIKSHTNGHERVVREDQLAGARAPQLPFS